MWFREIFIDIDNVLQFPVRSSLPFILAEHLLSLTHKTSLHDAFLFPFEIYNDAASMAVKTYASHFLYKELESEISVCIEMITFSFAETLFKVCRKSAAAIELPAGFNDFIKLKPNRYDLIVLQNKLDIMGSHVDFNQISTSKLNQKIGREISSTIALLTDLRYVIYVEHFIRVLRTTHALLIQMHLQLDDFTQIWRHALGLDNPLIVESAVLSHIQKILTFNQFKFNSVTKRFTGVRKIEIEPISTEHWAQQFAEYHQYDVRYFGVEHFHAIINLLSQAEISVLITTCIDKAIDGLDAMIQAYAEVAPVIRLLPTEYKDDLLGYFKFICDAYSTVFHTGMGKFYDTLRNLGNLISFLWYFEVEFNALPDNKSIIATLMESLIEVLLSNKELFIVDTGLDLESTISHRSFASLWSVLEFLYVSPKPIQLKQGDSFIPLSVFGDSPAVAAHVLITLCDQTDLYLFDSTLNHLLQLSRADLAKYDDDSLDDYLLHSTLVEQARKFAQMIAYPHRIKKN